MAILVRGRALAPELEKDDIIGPVTQNENDTGNSIMTCIRIRCSVI